MLYNETVKFCLLEHKDKLLTCKLCPAMLCRYNNSYSAYSYNYTVDTACTNDWVFKGSVTLRAPCSSIRDGFAIDEPIASDYNATMKDKNKFEFASFLDAINFLLGSGITYLSLGDAIYFTRIRNELGKL